MESPLISIIIPCRNEQVFIKRCVESLLQQKNLPGQIEIIIVDGLSSDGTDKVIKELSEKNKNVKFINNPQKITPVALNLGIMKSSGKFICILGAHSEYDSHFIESSYNIITTHPEVVCSGGPIISKGRSDFGKAAAIAMSSSIGVGNAKHRFPDYEGYAEMACFPMFRKEVFDKYGLYDERLVKNQDDEFCFRLRLNGEKIYISPIVKSSYYVRDSFLSLFRQYYEYGKWRIFVLRKHKTPISYRQQIPALFFVVILLLIILSLIYTNILIGSILPVFYLITLVVFAVNKLKKEPFVVVINIPFAIFALHFSYALGFISGLFKFGVDKLQYKFE